MSRKEGGSGGDGWDDWSAADDDEEAPEADESGSATFKDVSLPAGTRAATPPPRAQPAPSFKKVRGQSMWQRAPNPHPPHT